MLDSAVLYSLKCRSWAEAPNMRPFMSLERLPPGTRRAHPEPFGELFRRGAANRVLSYQRE
jgi:hypothetical protein